MGIWFPRRPGITSKPIPPPPKPRPKPKPKAVDAVVYAPVTPWSGMVDWLIANTIIGGISAVTTIASVLGALRTFP